MPLPSTVSPDDAVDRRQARGFGGHFYGVYPATVVSITDPADQGRVRVELPWAPDTGDSRYEAWARLATMMAGADRGSWFVPDVGDEVLVAFESGNPRRPYVVGSLWNGQDAPPETMDGGGENNVKVLRSRQGVQITLDDTTGQETLVLETPGGHTVTLADQGSTITVEDSGGSTVEMGPSGVSINTPGSVQIQGSDVTISAGSVTVSAGMSSFSGAVQVGSVITTPSIVASSYTPGAGNIW
jgi:uncharacterized protein involved in type VI secretion and phage assembly